MYTYNAGTKRPAQVNFSAANGVRVGEVLLPRLDALRVALQGALLPGRPQGMDPAQWGGIHHGFSRETKAWVGSVEPGPGHMVALADVEAFLGREAMEALVAKRPPSLRAPGQPQGDGGVKEVFPPCTHIAAGTTLGTASS